jgi:ABC-type sugar transport system ATPase subunit
MYVGVAGLLRSGRTEMVKLLFGVGPIMERHAYEAKESESPRPGMPLL